jgi:hypothetical protein
LSTVISFGYPRLLDLVQHLRDHDPRELAAGVDRQALAPEDIDHVKHAEVLAVLEAVEPEVHAPPLVRRRRQLWDDAKVRGCAGPNASDRVDSST